MITTDFRTPEPSEDNPWTIEKLQPYRLVGDPLADKCYQALYNENSKLVLSENNDIVDEILKRADADREEGGIYSQFVNSAYDVPDWVDFDRIEKARHFFTKCGVPGGVFVLTTASLVQSYGAANGSQVLCATGRLKDDVVKRVFETGYFIYQIMQKGALKPGKDGHKAVLQVRLLHCAIRHFLLTKHGWNTEKLGVPINQEDLAGTLVIFCNVLVEAMTKLGYHISEEEQEDYHHMWRYIGHVTGVQDSLLATSYQELLDLGCSIKEHQWYPEPHSKELVQALFESLHLRTVYFFLPTSFWKHLSAHLLGKEYGDRLELYATSRLWNFCIGLFVLHMKIQGATHYYIPLIADLSVHAANLFWTFFIMFGLKGRSVTFKMKKYLAR